MRGSGQRISILRIFTLIFCLSLGAGKTTLLRRACDLYLQQPQHLACTGFYTEEVRGSNGSWIGFDVVTLNNNARVSLARVE